jgi:hypothetical protein
MKDIPQLVADNPSLTDDSIYIGVGMTIYPSIYSTVGYEIAKLSRESRVQI